MKEVVKKIKVMKEERVSSEPERMGGEIEESDNGEV